MSQTPVNGNNGQGDIKHISYYVDVMWDSNAIGDIAKKHGIETIYYADIETLSVLTIWNQYTVHVYGKQQPGFYKQYVYTAGELQLMADKLMSD